MRMIHTLLTLLVVCVLAVLAYNHGTGNGWTLQPSAGSAGIDAERARRESVALVAKTAHKAGEAATQVEEAVGEAALTTKIKSTMVLDDYVKARAEARGTGWNRGLLDR